MRCDTEEDVGYAVSATVDRPCVTGVRAVPRSLRLGCVWLLRVWLLRWRIGSRR